MSEMKLAELPMRRLRLDLTRSHEHNSRYCKKIGMFMIYIVDVHTTTVTIYKLAISKQY
jgi:hypothetical protein